VRASDGMTLNIEETKTFAEQRQNPLIGDTFLLVVDGVDFTSKQPTTTAPLTHTAACNDNADECMF